MKKITSSKLKNVEKIIRSVSDMIEMRKRRRLSIRIKNLNRFFDISFLLSIICVDFVNIFKVLKNIKQIFNFSMNYFISGNRNKWSIENLN